MSLWRPGVVAAMLAVIALAAGCETVPVTGRSEIVLLSEGEEAKLGGEAYQQILTKSKLSTNAAQNEMVRRVGSRIAAVTGQNYQWEYRLIEENQANAFALPGGKVAVYTGILPITRDDAGLAVVLGHEISHVIARHSGERMS